MAAKGRAPSADASAGAAETHDGLGYCPFFQHTVELLGRRWTGSILRVLMAGPRRFGEIRTAIPGLSDRMLSERLHELEAEGWVHRDSTDEAPVYELSEQGLALEPIFDQIELYSGEWARCGMTFGVPGRIKP